MSLPKKSAPRRRNRKTRGRRRGFRSAKNVPERASCSVTQWIGTVTTANNMYNLRNVALNQFPRAVSTAQSYQHFRIKKIEMEFKPAYDTFIPQAGGGPGVNLQIPYLIYLIDKSGSVPTTVGSNDLKQMGAKPVRFDEKSIKVSWRPSVLTETFGNTLGVGQSQYRISPWLSTNANALNAGGFVPSSIDHLGLYWKVDRAGILPPGVEEYTYEVIITCEFEFKKPLVQVTGGAPAIKVNMPVYTAGGPPQIDLSGNSL